MKRTPILIGILLMALAAAGVQAQQTMPEMPAFPGMEGIPQQPSSPAGTTAAVGPKQPGTIRIGVALPGTQLGPGTEGVDAPEAIRNTVIQYLQGPLFEVIPLSSRIEMQLQAEAKQKECDYVFQSTVSLKKGGGMFGKLSSVSKITSSVVPMAGYAGTAESVAAGVASAATATAASVAGGFRNKDEISYKFKVTATDNSVVATNTSKLKAKEDGDDVLTPQIEQAINATLEAISKRTQQ